MGPILSLLTAPLVGLALPDAARWGLVKTVPGASLLRALVRGLGNRDQSPSPVWVLKAQGSGQGLVSRTLTCRFPVSDRVIHRLRSPAR